MSERFILQRSAVPPELVLELKAGWANEAPARTVSGQLQQQSAGAYCTLRR